MMKIQQPDLENLCYKRSKTRESFDAFGGKGNYFKDDEFGVVNCKCVNLVKSVRVSRGRVC